MATIEVLNIWISPGHDFLGQHGKGRQDHGIASMKAAHCVAGHGIEGDRYFDHKDNYKGQITFFSEEVAKGLEKDLHLPGFDRSAMRRNVLVSGVDLNTLIGKRFRLGEVVFSGSEECSPCYWMDEAVGKGAHKGLKGNGGLRCRIETSGHLQTGTQEIEIL